MAKREATLQKEKIVLERFQKLLRSGKDYTTNYMYSEAAKPCFIEGKAAGRMIRDHYRSIVTEKMVTYMLALKDSPRRERVLKFAKEFRLCEREARLIMTYIWRILR